MKQTHFVGTRINGWNLGIAIGFWILFIAECFADDFFNSFWANILCPFLAVVYTKLSFEEVRE